MARSYDFDRQNTHAKSREAQLDDIFQRHTSYQIYPATEGEQRDGLDRWFVCSSHRLSVEYKADERALLTGNVFVETISVDCRNITGWAYSSQADRLAYWVIGAQIFWISFQRLRQQLERWQSVYPVRVIPNRGKLGGWNTIGLLVPLWEFEAIAEQVIHDDSRLVLRPKNRDKPHRRI